MGYGPGGTEVWKTTDPYHTPNPKTTIFTDPNGADIPVPAAYDPGGRTEVAVVRPNGDWVRSDGSLIANFPAPPLTDPRPPSGDGLPGTPLYQPLPVPADYLGTGVAQPAWYRPEDGTWFILGQAPISYGRGPTTLIGSHGVTGSNSLDEDTPAPADYDGDGITDLSTFNPRTGEWKVRASHDGSESTVTMPLAGSPFAVPGDYFGVGHAQRAVYDPTSTWGWSIDGTYTDDLGSRQVDSSGNGTAFPAPADYTGVGHLQLAYVKTTGDWGIETSRPFGGGRQGLGASADPLVDGGNPAAPLATGWTRATEIPRITYLRWAIARGQ
jgi:hypothetical protein